VRALGQEYVAQRSTDVWPASGDFSMTNIVVPLWVICVGSSQPSCTAADATIADSSPMADCMSSRRKALTR
jgi:hypothetical protein